MSDKHVVCRCRCGAVEYRARAAPLFRMLCHCTICRRFNDAPQADVLVYRQGDVDLPAAGSVDFATYRPPPNVNRGKCASCGQPAIEVFRSPLLPDLAMVPTGMCDDVRGLPAPLAHVFYDRRVEDAEDELPKHSGYIRSQLAFVRYLLAAL